MAPPLTGTLVDALKSAQDFRTGSIDIDLDYYTGFLSTRNVAYGRDSNPRLFIDPSNRGRYALYNAVAAGQSFDTNLSGANTGWSRNAVDGGRALAFRNPEYPDAANPHLWLSYVSFGTWLFDEHNPSGISLSLRKVEDYFYFGIPTAAADLPTTGTASLEGIVQGKLYAADSHEYALQGTATFYADFSAGAFSTQLNMTGIGRDFTGTLDIGTLIGGGQISSDSRFRGIWTQSSNGYEGSILGSFFGPQAKEFGYSFGINNAALTALGGGSVVGGVPVNAPPAPPPPPPPLPPPPPPPAPPGSTFPLQGAQTFDTISATLRYNGRDGAYSFNDTPVGVTHITVTPDFEKGTYSIRNDVASNSFDAEQLPILPDPGKAYVSFATPLAANTPYWSLYILNNLAPGSGTNAPTLQFHYLSFGEWQQHDERDNNSHSITSFLYGTQTLPADMPKTGTANYSLLVRAESTAGYVSYVGDGALSADFSSGQLSTRIDVYGASIGGLYDFLYARMTGTGTIASGSANFAGQLAATNNSFSGSFQGAFFGPDAPEVGLTFSVKGQFGTPGFTSEQRMIGIAFGHKD